MTLSQEKIEKNMSAGAASSSAADAPAAKKPLPRVVDIADATEEDDNSENNKSLLRHLIGQLKVGMDLSRVTLPTHVLEPRSLLEKLTDFLCHADILVGAAEKTTALERIVEVTRWYLSGWHMRARGVKKPYNPILGETFECHYELPGNHRVDYFAEQVSHHPPISAFHVACPTAEMFIDGWYYPKSRFLGNSAASLGEGRCSLQLKKWGETYVLTWPNVYARGILFGSLTLEMGGKVSIECDDSGYHAEVEFKTKGMFGGEYNLIEGKIKHKGNKKTLYKIHGKWNEKMVIVDEQAGGGKHAPSEPFFDPAEQSVFRKVIAEDDDLPDTNSLRIWAAVTEALLKKDLHGATAAKTQIEEKQRSEKKDRKDRKEEWEVRFFHKANKHDWVYNSSPIDESVMREHESGDEKEEDADGE